MKNTFVTLVLFLLTFPHSGSSQDTLTDELRFEVNRIYPPISITKEKLQEAQTLMDLNPHYKSSWISAYISVEVLASYKGSIRKAVSNNDILSPEQKDIMTRADLGKDISVKVRYIPENTLTHNDPKEISFAFTVEPESEASYPGGEEGLKQYLKAHAIDKIPAGSFQNYDLATIQFTINEEGQIINPHVFEPAYRSAKDEKVDALLVEVLRNMPCWEPAAYANGLKVKQDFVLTVGNHNNCVLPLLNIRRENNE